ncbi:MAG: TonB-dependent receptor [Caulobacter sp.]|nr:TonB-dependent receptor [Caulobacter sp.]
MSRKIALAFLSGASALAMVAGGSVAQAQQVGGDPAPKADAAHATTVDEVIVTATRRAERIHDVPGAVSAVSGQMLQDLRANSLADFAAFTPGVSFQATSPSTNKVVIRGITTGNQLNSAIGLYLDDVAVGSSTPFGSGAQAINIGLFDLQRVEVLSGPQGTLFGANALGGTLRYITETPALTEVSGQVEVEGNDLAHGEPGGALRASFNAPLGDKAALRVVGIVQDDSGFVDDPSHGRHNLGDAHTLHGRASLLLEVSPDVSVQLNAFALSTRSNGYAVSMRDPVTHAPTGGDYDQSFASAQPSDADLYMGSGVIRWNLDWANLTAITAYQSTQNHSVSDLSTAYSAILGPILGPAGVNPYVLVVDTASKRFTQEVRLASPDNRAFEWVAGAFYSNEETTQTDVIGNNADPNGLLLGLPIGRFDLPSTAKDFALFGNVTVRISPAVDVTLGARQTWNDQVFASSGLGFVVNPPAPTTAIVGRGTSKESVQTYLFNLRYRPTDATMVYARIASGYRPGGPNLQTGGAGSGNLSFAADKLWNYEIGLKQTLGGRGFLNLSAYHIDWTNIQQVRNIGGVNQLVNAGDARVDGAEASLSYRLLARLSLLATASYTNARLTTAAPLLGLSQAGARLPLSPRFSWALAANYSFDLTPSVHGALNVAVRQVGERNSGYPGSTVSLNYELGGYTVVDATMSLTTETGWQVSPYIKNLFDVRGEVSATTATNQFVPGAPVPVTLTQPRTIGLSVGRRF